MDGVRLVVAPGVPGLGLPESGCLGTQPKAGGKLHLRLNTSMIPTVNKYHKRKLQRNIRKSILLSTNQSVKEKSLLFFIVMRHAYTQSCLTLCGPPTLYLLLLLSGFSHVQLCAPMDCSPSGSSVHWILPARILE